MIPELKERFFHALDKRRLISPDTIYGEDYYASMKKDEWIADSKEFADVVIETFDPDSVVSFGCGIGRNLRMFRDRGVVVLGIDGSEQALEHSMIDNGEFVIHDLREPYIPSSEFDLSLCIEVLEHVPRQFNDVIANSIVRSADTHIITAAEPGQGGTYHINENPAEFWIRLFEDCGATYDNSTTNALKTELSSIESMAWMHENILVFRN